MVDHRDGHPQRAVAVRRAADPRPGVGPPRGARARRRLAGAVLAACRRRHAVADVSLHERLGGLDSFYRLLVIPLLLAQFRRSENGRWILIGFLASCTV